MARGFDSKFVAGQQEDMSPASAPADSGDLPDPVRFSHRRRLELARVDVVRRLDGAQAPAYREMLTRALAALEAELATLR